MDITAAMVKELRELTGAGIMACKRSKEWESGQCQDFLQK